MGVGFVFGFAVATVWFVPGVDGLGFVVVTAAAVVEAEVEVVVDSTSLLARAEGPEGEPSARDSPESPPSAT